jgi:tRNA/tmRNA/rRNA uracil-C5-methylase (TrmA/RlmC/RlmD family)
VADNVGTLIRLTTEALKSEGKDAEREGYKIKSVRAIDLFPQTHHAEGLLVLMRGD